MIDINKLKLSAREQNIAKILNCVVNGEEVSSLDIGKETGLSVSTISRVLSLLKEKKIIVNVGKELTDIGRRPDLLRLNKDFGHIVFLDVFQGGIVSYLADLNNNILNKEEFIFDQDITLNAFKEGITNVYDRLVTKENPRGFPILAAGISIPGVVNEEDNTISRIPNIYNFNEINLSSFITDILDVPAIICNESCLAAVGLKIVRYPEYDNLVYVSFTEPMGIGGGVILDGKLYKGTNNAAGEIGNMFIDIRNFDENYQSPGCMETIAGLGNLYNELLFAIEQGKAQILKGLFEASGRTKLNIDLIEQAITEKDHDTQEIYDRYIKIWAIGIINIVSLFDPRIIIIGGKIKPNNKWTLDKIKQYVKKGVYCEPKLKISEISEKAAFIGGLHTTKSYVFNNLLLKEALS